MVLSGLFRSFEVGYFGKIMKHALSLKKLSLNMDELIVKGD